MLKSLSIRNFVIIDSLDLHFESGLSALTGETGAGKSILLDALGLALGMRSNASSVRVGAKESLITAEFKGHDTWAVSSLLTQNSIPLEENLLIRRVIPSQGKGKAYINDHQVNMTFLRQLGDTLLEIHGQFDRLLNPSLHRKLLDAYLLTPELLEKVRLSYQEWQDSQKKYQEAHLRLDHLKRHEDFLKYQQKELEKLNPQPGEEGNLLEKRKTLSAFSKVFDSVGQAYQTLQTGKTIEYLHQAYRALQKGNDGENPHMVAALKSLEKSLSEATEAVAQLEDLLTGMDDHPLRLQKIDDRLQALRGASRKHHVLVDELTSFLERLKMDLETLDQAEEHTKRLEKIGEDKKNIFCKNAFLLRDIRQKKAAELDISMAEELVLLRLPDACFQTVISPLTETHWNETGMDKIQFLVSMNKGQDLSPLEKTASGGELSRLMLGLKATLATTATLPTIIFDEIDIGVGGAIAATIGQRMAKLSQHIQVLAITHSPQVAAAADHHYLVEKKEVNHHMQTKVIKLPLEKRREEIARMLSGIDVTPEARAAANTLLSRYEL